MQSPSILVVRPGALGDTILTVPLIGSIRAASPAARITFLGSGMYRDVMPAHVDVARFDSPQWAWLLAGDEADRPPARGSYDTAYVLLNRPDGAVRNLQRAGTAAVLYAASQPPCGVHVVEHLHGALGLAVPQRLPCLGHLGSAGRDAVLWVHPGSGGPSKCLPLSLLVPLVRELRDRTGFRVAITFSEEDGFLTRSLEWQRLTGIPDALMIANRPLAELCQTLGRASLFIGNDSGIGHLAAALGVPSAVFFVKTDPACWAPWVPPELLRVIDLRAQDLAERDLLVEVPLLLELIAR